jgi:protein transport protein SEC20
VKQVEQCIAAFESCGKTGTGTEEVHSLPRLNGDAKDGTQLHKTLQFRLDFMAQQLPTFEEVQCYGQGRQQSKGEH